MDEIISIKFVKDYSPKIDISPLPYELLFEIFQFLSVNKDLPNVQLTCKKFQEITDGKYFWIVKIQKYNPNLSKKELNDIQNPKDFLKNTIETIKESEKLLSLLYSNRIESRNYNSINYHRFSYYDFAPDMLEETHSHYKSYLRKLLELSKKLIKFKNFKKTKEILDVCSLKRFFIEKNRLPIIFQYSKIGEFKEIQNKNLLNNFFKNIKLSLKHNDNEVFDEILKKAEELENEYKENSACLISKSYWSKLKNLESQFSKNV